MKFYIIIFLLFFSAICAAPLNADHDTRDPGSKQIRVVEKRIKKLQKLSYAKAIIKYGVPQESSEIYFTKKNLERVFSEEFIQEHLPNYQSNPTGHLKEASWKVMESWITVWYIIERHKWRPLSTLADM